MLQQFTLRRTAVLIGAFVLLSTTSARAALTPEQKCQRAKIDAWSALIGCRNDALVREIAGLSSNRERCDTRFANQMASANDLGSCRFLDNGDQTATDLDTGLMWEMKTAANAGETFSWAEAMSNHVSLLDGTLIPGLVMPGVPALGGHSDWRLPNLGELIGFFAGACAGPCVDPVLGEIAGGPHWTSITRNTDATQALYVLDLGTSFGADWAAKSSAFAARGVRAAFQ